MVLTEKKEQTVILALLKSLNEPCGTVSPPAYKEREGSVFWKEVPFTSEGSGLMSKG